MTCIVIGSFSEAITFWGISLYVAGINAAVIIMATKEGTDHIAKTRPLFDLGFECVVADIFAFVSLYL